jgi:hypothetical protein
MALAKLAGRARRRFLPIGLFHRQADLSAETWDVAAEADAAPPAFCPQLWKGLWTNQKTARWTLGVVSFQTSTNGRHRR